MTPTRLQLLLGGVCAALGAMLGWANIAPRLPVPEAPATPPKVAGGDVDKTTDVMPLALDEIKARPPFWPDRQVPTPVAMPVPAAPPASPPPPPPSPGSELTLVGIVNGPAARIAVFRVKSSGKLERHAEGEFVGQWSLERILIDRVVLLRGGSEDELAFPPPGERKPAQASPSMIRNIPMQIVPLTPPPRP